MAQFATARDRDAYPVIRGFRYQVDQTVLRWLQLDAAQTLELERGEDIDRVSRALISGEESDRTLEQVKHLVAPITLRSAPCLEALANAVEHRGTDPNLSLSFCFCTNAEVTIERPSPFKPRRSGIEVWKGVSAGSDARGFATELNGIRQILSRATRPADYNEAAWRAFLQFVTDATDDDLLRLVRQFTWSTGQPGSEDLEPLIVTRIAARGLAASEQQARSAYRQLFLAAIKLLSRPGLKRLTADDLREIVVGNVSAADAGTLDRIERRVFALEGRLAAVESSVHQQADLLVQIVTAQHGITARLVDEVAPPSLQVPPPLERGVMRSKAVEQVARSLSTVAWLWLYGTSGCGKSELAKLIAGAGQFGRVAYLSLRDRTSDQAELDLARAMRSIAGVSGVVNRAELVAAAATTMGAGALLVIDDVPQLSAGDRLSQWLVDLARAWRGRSVRLLTTSPYPLPGSVADQLPEGACCTDSAPPFDVDDVTDLFAAWAMPAGAVSRELTVLMTVRTEGHPTLLTGIARYLARRGWCVDATTLPHLLQDGPLADVLEENLRRLLASVDDDDDRRLVYRLGLIDDAFTRDLALRIASVPVAVERPRERMARVSGPWLQVDANQLLRVSPLVRPLARTELSDAERRSVWVALALEITARPSHSVTDIASAVRYLGNAAEHERACVLLIAPLNAARDLPPEQVRVLLAISWFSAPLPKEVSPANGLFLRSFQIELAVRLGLPTQRLFTEADGLVASTGAADAWATFAFTAKTVAIRAAQDFRTAVADIVVATTRLLEAEVVDGPMHGLAREWVPARLLLLVVLEISLPEHLAAWLDTIETLPADEVRRAFEPKAGNYHAALLAIHRVWMHEFERGPGRRDWGRIEALLARAVAIAERLLLDPLSAAAASGRITVLADYLDSPSAAVELAESLLNRERSATFELIVVESLGRQLYFKKDLAAAAAWLGRAARVSCDGFAHLRADARIYLSACIAGQAPGGALALVNEADAIARGDDGRGTIGLKRAVIAAELAVACWLAEDMAGSFDAYDAAAEDLLACGDRGDDWRATFVLFGHAGGYLAQVAAGVLPTLTRDGEPYAAPYRTMFLTAYTAERAALFEPRRESGLPILLCMFAESVGDDGRAAEWATRGIDGARREGEVTGVAKLGLALVPHLVRDRRFVDALDTAREMGTAYATLPHLRQRGDDVFDASPDWGQVLGAQGDGPRREADLSAVLFGGLQVAIGLALMAVGEPTAVRAVADEVVTYCRSTATEAVDSELWEGFANCVGMTYLNPGSPAGLNRLANAAAGTDHEVLHLLGYVCMSMLPACDAKTAALLHAGVMPGIERILNPNSSAYRLVVMPFFVAYWGEIVNRQPFRFAVPGLTTEAWRAAVQVPVDRRVRAALRVIVAGLGVRLPDKMAASREWLKGP